MACWSRDELFDRREMICFSRRLVPADAVNARKPHRDARFMARRAMNAVEGNLQHELGRHGAHRAETLDRMIANPAVELAQLLIGKAEIGFANGDELGLLPDAERVIGVE